MRFKRNNVNSVYMVARMTWLGHASVLAEVDGAAILTDPVFSSRASLVQFAGPARYANSLQCAERSVLPKSGNPYTHMGKYRHRLN